MCGLVPSRVSSPTCAVPKTSPGFRSPKSPYLVLVPQKPKLLDTLATVKIAEFSRVARHIPNIVKPSPLCHQLGVVRHVATHTCCSCNPDPGRLSTGFLPTNIKQMSQCPSVPVEHYLEHQTSETENPLTGQTPLEVSDLSEGAITSHARTLQSLPEVHSTASVERGDA